MSSVKLNVGGTHFQTSRGTLNGTKLEGILEGTDNDIFIDRDPHNFRLILNFLRDRHVELPNCQKKVKEVLAEAEFYQIPGLIELCKSRLNTSYQLIKNTPELFDVLMEAKKDVLVWKVSTDNAATIAFPYNREDFDKFVEKYKERCQVVLFLLDKMESYEWQVEFYPIDKKASRPGAEGFPDFYEEYDRNNHRW